MPHCPVCRDGYSVQKVSAIVAGGTWSGSGMGVAFSPDGPAIVPTFTSGTTTSRLASVLADPTPPRMSGGVAAVGGVLVFLALLTGVPWLNQAISQGPGSVLALTFMVPTLVSGLAGLVLIVVYARRARSRARQRPMWEAAQSRWSELYYCYRDDAVFHPATGAWRPLNAVRDLVWGATISEGGGGDPGPGRVPPAPGGSS